MKRQRNGDIAGMGDNLRDDRDGVTVSAEDAHPKKRESKQRRTQKRRAPASVPPDQGDSGSDSEYANGNEVRVSVHHTLVCLCVKNSTMSFDFS